MFRYTPLSERYTVSGVFPFLIYPFGYGFITVCAAFRPSTARTVFTGIALIAITLLLFNVNVDAPYTEFYGPLTLWGSMYPHWVDRVVLASQDTEKWHKMSTVKGKENGKPVERATFNPPREFWNRLKWSWSQTVAFRGYGYSWQVKKIPAAPPRGTGRWTFVLTQLVRFYVFMTIVDIGKIFAAHTPLSGYRYWEDYKPYHTPEAEPVFFRLPYLQRIGCCWLLVCLTYWSMSFITSFIYAISVALGIWKPEECPKPFGDLRYLYSVRNAWSVVWHQFMRRIATFPGTRITKDLLHLKSGTFLSKYIQLFVGFATTGAVHSIASLLVFGHDGGEMPFWISQAMGIMFEDYVVILARHLGIKDNRIWRFVGFLWTVAWFSVSLQQYMGNAVEVGGLVSRRPPDPFGVESRLERFGEWSMGVWFWNEPLIRLY